MLILGIETSLDETAAAVVKDTRILSNVLSSQVELHRKYGGVVPIIAQRAHRERIDAVITEALKNASMDLRNIDALAVTIGPGQALALEVGLEKAKTIAAEYRKPLVAVSHMEGHLLSAFAENSQGHNPGGAKVAAVKFPLLGFLISGGHTELILVNNIGSYQILGQTLDDAAGEAFDKVGRMLGFGYPGGPVVEEMAKQGDERAFNLPLAMSRRTDLNFSYSGLKTAVMYQVRELKKADQLSKKSICNMAASFQRVMALSLVKRLEMAIKKTTPHGLLLGGGVASNLYVRQAVRKVLRQNKLPLFIPYDKRLFTDNAGMIAVAGSFKARRGEFVKDLHKLDRQPNLTIDQPIRA